MEKKSENTDKSVDVILNIFFIMKPDVSLHFCGYQRLTTCWCFAPEFKLIFAFILTLLVISLGWEPV